MTPAASQGILATVHESLPDSVITSLGLPGDTCDALVAPEPSDDAPAVGGLLTMPQFLFGTAAFFVVMQVHADAA